jgi:hypothetical protein
MMMRQTPAGSLPNSILAIGVEFRFRGETFKLPDQRGRIAGRALDLRHQSTNGSFDQLQESGITSRRK